MVFCRVTVGWKEEPEELEVLLLCIMETAILATAQTAGVKSDAERRSCD